MISLLFDEDFNNRVYRALRRVLPATDVTRVQDEGLSARGDAEVLEWAAGAGRVVVSHDVRTMRARAPPGESPFLPEGRMRYSQNVSEKESEDVSELDRVETNFRLALISQREMNVNLQEVATSLRTFGTKFEDFARGVNEFARGVKEDFDNLATRVDTVAEKGEQTAERLEDSIEVMKSFAAGQVEMRKTLAEYGRRLDALEGKKAS